MCPSVYLVPLLLPPESLDWILVSVLGLCPKALYVLKVLTTGRYVGTLSFVCAH